MDMVPKVMEYPEMMDCEAKWKQDGTIRKCTKMKWPHAQGGGKNISHTSCRCNMQASAGVNEDHVLRQAITH